jgi:hypothetical protein
MEVLCPCQNETLTQIETCFHCKLQYDIPMSSFNRRQLCTIHPKPMMAMPSHASKPPLCIQCVTNGYYLVQHGNGKIFETTFTVEKKL